MPSRWPNHTAATAEAIDADGWLHTGDVGRLDERGYLTITDRLKDMYICGGFNVYPAEVEQVLTRHPGVAEAAVIGVPDGRLGEVAKAFVVLRPAARATPGELIEFCQATLANYKVPRQIGFRTELPRTQLESRSSGCSDRSLDDQSRRAQPTSRRGRRRRRTRRRRTRGALRAARRLSRGHHEPAEYRNAQNSVMTYALDAAFERAVNDNDVRVIVLAGAGDHFSAGHDIGTPGRDVHVPFDRKAVLWWDHTDKAGADARYAREMEVYLGMCRRWREMPKPSIAIVQGACIVGGLMLAWVCDLIVASEDAFFRRSRRPDGHPWRRVFRPSLGAGTQVRQGGSV